MTDSKKFEEGLEYIRAAEKSLKTTLLKWRPDYESAADEYNKAATCFKNSKSHEQCKESLLKAAECHKQARSLFHAAKCLENAMLACKELGEMKSIHNLAERAASMYQQQGSPEAAAAALDKAAKIIEPSSPQNALTLYQHATDIVLGEDSVRQAAEFVSKVSRILIKLQMYDEAAESVRKEIMLHQQTENLPAIGRLTVVLVLVQLAREDMVAAEKAFKEWGNCCEAPEVQTLESLLAAYDEDDPESAKMALNSSFIKHMDVEYARLAREVPLPKGATPAPVKSSVIPNAAPSYVSPKANQESSGGGEGILEDDDEDDLK